MPAYDFNSGSYDNFSNFSFINKRANYFEMSIVKTTLQNQQYFKMRAYLIPSGSYVTWITTGSLDSTGANSGYPTSSLSDITVLPQFS